MTNVQILTLRRAAQICGGLGELAMELGVSGDQLWVWLQGDRPIPPEVFRGAADIVLNDSGCPSKPH
ncbi:MAG TPA: YdaS family helix-turn-helix protein [Burkholderiales bacterium]|jgi:hypothetical protein